MHEISNLDKLFVMENRNVDVIPHSYDVSIFIFVSIPRFGNGDSDWIFTPHKREFTQSVLLGMLNNNKLSSAFSLRFVTISN